MKISQFILRNWYTEQLTALALKLTSRKPSQWTDWILGCVTHLSGRGSSTESILDFLSIVAEEVENADLIGPSK
jgi:hypothetical protein